MANAINTFWAIVIVNTTWVRVISASMNHSSALETVACLRLDGDIAGIVEIDSGLYTAIVEGTEVYQVDSQPGNYMMTKDIIPATQQQIDLI